jgi:hypothetical protein
MTETDSPHTTYTAAGVDITAGERAVAQLRPHAERASRPEVLGGIGGFAGRTISPSARSCRSESQSWSAALPKAVSRLAVLSWAGRPLSTPG